MSAPSVRRTAVGIGALFAAGALSLGLSAPAHADEPDHRRSFECTSSAAGPDTNLSWSQGVTTSSVYYNNHCAKGTKVTLVIANTLVTPGSAPSWRKECWTVPQGKGKKVFDTGRLTDVTKGC